MNCPLQPWRYLFLAFYVLPSFLRAVSSSAADAGVSPHAKVQPIGLDEVRWTHGFWADRFELCRTQTIPSMGRLMEGTNYSQYLQNFRIAAGLAEGRPRGAPFNDGDFYKWLEGACAVVAVTKGWHSSPGCAGSDDSVTPSAVIRSPIRVPPPRLL